MQTKTKIPVTPAVMLLILHRLKEKKWPSVNKKLFWAIATTLFVGSFRVGEVLAIKSDKHIRGGSLLGENITRGSATINGQRKSFIKVRLNNPKEDKARKGAEVELFSLDGIFFDPVHALNRWLEKSKLKLENSSPVFRWENGNNVTPQDFNRLLQDLLKEDLKYDDNTISSHSFRAGVASTMAKMGYSEEMIRLQGRWNSDAYLRYCRLGRANKLEDQYNLFSSLAAEAERNNIL